MIDDRIGFSAWRTSEEEIIGKLLAINPGYQITFHDSCLRLEDIVVASLP
jgi:hypothetical protein